MFFVLGPFATQIDSMIFLSPLLDVIRMSVSFLAQSDPEIPCP